MNVLTDKLGTQLGENGGATLMAVRPVAAPVRQQVVDNIRAALVSGALTAGQRLIERELCERLGVSRPSVREALRQLEAEGLIENIPNKGPIVRGLTRADAESVLQVRGALEALASRLFALRATDAEIEVLEAVVRQSAEAAAAGDDERVIALVERFYDMLVSGSGNDVLPGLLRSIRSRIQIFRRLCSPMPRRVSEGLREIREIVRAIRQRDPDAAAAASNRHIERVTDATLRALPSALSDDGDSGAQTGKADVSRAGRKTRGGRV
ncbi:MAG: GntR family transcriptional regulator [Lautropia sp.]